MKYMKNKSSVKSEIVWFGVSNLFHKITSVLLWYFEHYHVAVKKIIWHFKKKKSLFKLIILPVI